MFNDGGAEVKGEEKCAECSESLDIPRENQWAVE